MDIKLLTREEVVALTDEQRQRYVDYACAEQGIKLLAAPIKPINPFIIERKDTAYCLPSGYVKDKATVEAIDDLLAKTVIFRTAYNYGMGYNYRHLEPTTSNVSCNSERFYVKDDLMAAEQGLTKYESDNNYFEKLEKEYKENEEKKKNIVDGINTYVWDVQREVREINNLKAHFEEYKTLADGNEELAKRFLIKAYPEAEQLLGITITQIPAEEQKEKDPE